MSGLKWLYFLLCAIGVLIGLYPSIFLNVGAYYAHGQNGYAGLQLALCLLMAGCPLVLPILNLAESVIAVLLLIGLLLVSVGNGVEAIAMARGELTSAREVKIHSQDDWKARIEEWKAEKESLKDKYTPTTEASLTSAQEGVDSTNKARDAACRYAGKACDDRTRDAKEAQGRLDQVSRDYGLTKRVEKLERDIEDNRNKIRDLGDPPPDHIAKAKTALSGLFINPVQDKEVITAFVCEGAAAFAPRFMVLLVGLLFTTALGVGWMDSPSPKRESPAVILPPIAVDSPPKVSVLPLAKKPAAKGKMALYLEGVDAWLIVARSGDRLDHYTPGHAFPHYRKFCEERGFTPCKAPTTLGTLLTSKLQPAKKAGGSYYYALNLGSRLELVKTA